MLVLEDEGDFRKDALRQRRLNEKHYTYDRVFGEDSTQVKSDPTSGIARFLRLIILIKGGVSYSYLSSVSGLVAVTTDRVHAKYA